MVQSRGISRLNGEFYSIAACIERAGTAHECAAVAARALAAEADRYPGGLVEPLFIDRMRLSLWATAVAALAVLVVLALLT
jgi:hypothetical protein